MYPDQLYQLAFAFRQVKLWKRLYDSELFAVTLPDGGIGYCCVMGFGGEHLSLALYVGSKGLDSYRLLQEAGSTEMHPLKSYEAMLSQSCLQCSFESKDFLSPQELSSVRSYASEHRISFRGANAFPQFMSFRPATHPWPISDQADVQQLIAALEAALEVAERINGRGKEQLGFREGPAHDRSIPLLTKSKAGFTWGLHPLPPKQPVQYPEPELKDELLLARLKKAKKRGGAWVCDVVLVPQPTMEDEASVPVFPYTLLTAVCEIETVLPTEIVLNFEGGAETLLRALGNRMLEHRIPKEIRVVNARTFALLKNLAAMLKIGLVLQPRNELLDEMEMDFLEYTSSQTTDTVEDETARFAEMFLLLDDDSFLSMPDELWGHLYSLERQGMLDGDVAKRIRALSKKR